MTSQIKRLLLFGPPGAGKGTQAAVVAERLGIPHVDTGSIIRDNIGNETSLGLEAKAFVEKGELIPNELVIRLIADRLGQEDCGDGWLLDGFPRSLEQARALSTLGPDGGEAAEKVVFLDVPEDLLVQRLTSRRICPQCKAVYNLITLQPKTEGVCDKCGSELVQRPDDSDESIRTRFRVYREETEPIAGYYREKNLLMEIDGTGGVEEGTKRILAALEEKSCGCCN